MSKSNTKAEPPCTSRAGHKWGDDELAHFLPHPDYVGEVVDRAQRHTCARCGVQRITQPWVHREGDYTALLPWYRYPGRPEAPRGMRLVRVRRRYESPGFERRYGSRDGELYCAKYDGETRMSVWLVADGPHGVRDWDGRTNPGHVSKWQYCLAPR